MHLYCFALIAQECCLCCGHCFELNHCTTVTVVRNDWGVIMCSYANIIVCDIIRLRNASLVAYYEAQVIIDQNVVKNV